MNSLRQRTIVLAIIFLVLVLSLVGCGNSVAVDAPTNTDISQEQLLDPPRADPNDLTEVPNEGEEPPSEIAISPIDVPQDTENKLVVHYIDVGQADSILIQIPNGKNVLIDAGNNDDSDKIVGYLQDQGVGKLDLVIGTHPHEDHIGGMDTIIETFEIGQVVMPKVDSNTVAFSDLIAAIKAKNLKITAAEAGLILELGPEVTAQLLAPNSDSYDNLNSYSAVMKLTYGTTSFLFTGDADEVSEKEMLAAGYDLSANVIKVGHHGSKSSSSSGFLAQVCPQYSVVTVGKDNKYGHPSSATMARLSTVGSKSFRTDEVGTIIMESDGQEIVIVTEF